MRSKLIKPFIPVVSAVAIALLGAVSANASALIIGQNGFGTHATNPMSPEANVELLCTSGAATEACIKTFFSNDQHEIQWSGIGTLSEQILNSTGIPWTDFHFEFIGFSELPFGSLQVTCDAGGFSQCATTIGESNGTNLSQWVFFNTPLTPGVNSGFTINITLSGSGTIIQHPTIGVPEPGTLALFGLGLAGLGFARRRKTQAA